MPIQPATWVQYALGWLYRIWNFLLSLTIFTHPNPGLPVSSHHNSEESRRFGIQIAQSQREPRHHSNAPWDEGVSERHELNFLPHPSLAMKMKAPSVKHRRAVSTERRRQRRMAKIPSVILPADMGMEGYGDWLNDDLPAQKEVQRSLPRVIITPSTPSDENRTKNINNYDRASHSASFVMDDDTTSSDSVSSRGSLIHPTESLDISLNANKTTASIDPQTGPEEFIAQVVCAATSEEGTDKTVSPPLNGGAFTFTDSLEAVAFRRRPAPLVVEDESAKWANRSRQSTRSPFDASRAPVSYDFDRTSNFEYTTSTPPMTSVLYTSSNDLHSPAQTLLRVPQADPDGSGTQYADIFDFDMYADLRTSKDSLGPPVTGPLNRAHDASTSFTPPPPYLSVENSGASARSLRQDSSFSRSSTSPVVSSLFKFAHDNPISRSPLSGPPIVGGIWTSSRTTSLPVRSSGTAPSSESTTVPPVPSVLRRAGTPPLLYTRRASHSTLVSTPTDSQRRTTADSVGTGRYGVDPSNFLPLRLQVQERSDADQTRQEVDEWNAPKQVKEEEEKGEEEALDDKADEENNEDRRRARGMFTSQVDTRRRTASHPMPQEAGKSTWKLKQPRSPPQVRRRSRSPEPSSPTPSSFPRPRQLELGFRHRISQPPRSLSSGGARTGTAGHTSDAFYSDHDRSLSLDSIDPRWNRTRNTQGTNHTRAAALPQILQGPRPLRVVNGPPISDSSGEMTTTSEGGTMQSISFESSPGATEGVVKALEAEGLATAPLHSSTPKKRESRSSRGSGRRESSSLRRRSPQSDTVRGLVKDDKENQRIFDNRPHTPPLPAQGGRTAALLTQLNRQAERRRAGIFSAVPSFNETGTNTSMFGSFDSRDSHSRGTVLFADVFNDLIRTPTTKPQPRDSESAKYRASRERKSVVLSKL